MSCVRRYFFFNYYCFSVWVCWVWFLLRSAVWADHLLYFFLFSFFHSFLNFRCGFGRTWMLRCDSNPALPLLSVHSLWFRQSRVSTGILFEALASFSFTDYSWFLGNFPHSVFAFWTVWMKVFSKTKTNKNKALHVGYLLCFCHCWVLC